MTTTFVGGPCDGFTFVKDELLGSKAVRASIPWEEYRTEPAVGSEGDLTWHYVGVVETPVETPKVRSVRSVQTSDLRAAREELGLNRQDVSNRTDGALTVAKVARIETKGGTTEEVALYEKALGR